MNNFWNWTVNIVIIIGFLTVLVGGVNFIVNEFQDRKAVTERFEKNVSAMEELRTEKEDCSNYITNDNEKMCKDALIEKLEETENALNEYKKVYDGLIIFEDGSWTYEDEEYFFWNWDTEYIGK